MKQIQYDAVVIGSGVGGLSTGALLAHNGFKTLVAERLPALGGRCSTLDYEGYKVPVGAVGVPSSGPFREVFDTVGADFEVKQHPEGKYLVDGTEVPLPEKGQFNAILSHCCSDEEEYNRIRKAMRLADTWEKPSNEITLRDWLLQYTSNESVHALFQNVCAAFIIANAHEASAREFFEIRTGMMRSYGAACFSLGGSIALMESLARAIKSMGGGVWTRSPVTRILVDDYKVQGVVIDTSEGDVEVTAKVVVSNAGPRKTVELTGRDKFDSGYLKEVDRLRPSLQMWVTTVSDRPLYDWPVVTTLKTRRMINMLIPSMVIPEMAPPGRHVHYSISGPAEQTGHWNMKEEVDLHIQDLKDNIPLFSQYGEVLHVGCYHGDWPTITNTPFAGYEPLSQKTPVENLYNVGEAVGAGGWLGGTPGCALTAKTAVEEIIKREKREKARAARKSGGN
ncbi:MAG: NAD(P)/FAD-dependent oxidoreductase [Dehalococcoidia bacterium]